MPLIDYIKDRRNRIVVSSVSAVGLIIAGAAGISVLTPSYQTRDSNGQVTWQVNLKGDSTQSGAIASKTLTAANCDVKGTSTGMLTCGTDSAGSGGGGVNTGGVLALGDRWVETDGDTMTGALTIDLTTGFRGLNVVETASGAHIHAEKGLSSSGGLTVEGTMSGSSFFGAGLGDCDGATQTLNWDATTGDFSCGTDANTGTSYTAGQSLTLAGTVFSLTPAHSGTVIQASLILASSGGLTWEGLGSGASLYVGDDFEGAGLSDCDGATQTLNWDSTEKRFGCGTDADTTYIAGQGLILTSNSFSLAAIHSGTVIRAVTTLASSGTLVWEGSASGQSLYISREVAFAGSGLTITRSGSVVFNELGRPVDLRMEGDTNDSLFFLDGSADRIGIGTRLPDALLDVLGAMSGQTLTLNGGAHTTTNFDSNGGRVFIKTTPANSQQASNSGALVVLQLAKDGSSNPSVNPTSFDIPAAYLYASGSSVLKISVGHDQITGPSSGHILFGYRSNFDTNLYRQSASRLRTDDAFWANSLSGAALTINGFASLISAQNSTSLTGVVGNPAIFNKSQTDGAMNLINWYGTTGAGGAYLAGIMGVQQYSNPTTVYADFLFSSTNIGGNLVETMRLTGTGNLGIGTSVPASKVQISGGGLCVGSDANCNSDNNTEGIVYSSATAMTIYDVAERYPTKDKTLTGTILLALDLQNPVFVKKAQKGDKLIGIHSLRPAIDLGGFKTEETQFKDEKQVSVALVGRVPLEVTLENGNIEIGDEITISSTPGVGMKADREDQSVGYALEPCKSPKWFYPWLKKNCTIQVFVRLSR